MGQYFKLCVLNTKNKNAKNKDKVKAYLESWDFGNGAKLTEFSWIDNTFVSYFESLINDENGIMAGLPIIAAGDYADEEPSSYKKDFMNIYDLAIMFGKQLNPDWFDMQHIQPKHYRYIINKDKKLFIDTKKMKSCRSWVIDGKRHHMRMHPLPLLCADGNGRGGGDYFGANKEVVGSWCRNVVVVSDAKPNKKEYKEVFYDFRIKL